MAKNLVRTAKLDKSLTVLVGRDVGKDVAVVGQEGINALTVEPPTLSYTQPVRLRKGTR